MSVPQYIDVPKYDLDNYEYLLRHYYNFDHKDFQFLRDPSIINRYDRVQLSDETTTHYYLTFKIASHKLVSKLLPETIVRPGITYFNDIVVLNDLKLRFRNWLTMDKSRVIRCGNYDRFMFHHNLSDVIKQLAMENIIEKFYHADYGDRYLIVVSGVIFDIWTCDGFFMSSNCYVTFNLNSGFSLDGSEARKMNEKFREWKSHGDLRRPIFEPNILGTLTKASPRT